MRSLVPWSPRVDRACDTRVSRSSACVGTTGRSRGVGLHTTGLRTSVWLAPIALGAKFLLFGLLLSGAPVSAQGDQGTNGADSAPANRAPAGYPQNLVYIPGGEVILGLSSKEVEELAKLRGKFAEREIARTATLMARSLGQHEVQIADFFIGRTEVTNEQYAAFIKAVWPRVPFPFHWWKKDDLAAKRKEFFEKEENQGQSFIPEEQWRFRYDKCEWAIPEGDEKKPVTWVTHHDALLYCAWAGLRLPTEAEWQHAYQGEKPQHYIFGAEWDDNWLAQLELDSLKNRVLKQAGAVEANRSPFGVYDLMGNVWEWTMSTFHEYDNFDRERRDLERWAEKEKRRNPDLASFRAPLFDESKYVLRGGSYLSVGDYPLAFHGATRFPIDGGSYNEGTGFRVAKSLKPGFDATLLWARTRLQRSALADVALDVPDTKAMRQLQQGKLTPADFGQIGIERWDLEDDVIQGHGLISFVAVKELPECKRLNEWAQETAENCGSVHFGRPVAALFTTERCKIKQGLDGEVILDPGIYTFEFRGKGLPKVLEKAMHAGSRVLRLNKGERPTDEQLGAMAEKQKESKGGRGDDEILSNDWTRVVDSFGIEDEITRKYPRVTVRDIKIEPGSITIPTDKNLLLVRDHEKGYVGYIQLSNVIDKEREGSKDAQLGLEIDQASGKVQFRGGPMVPQARGRLMFDIPVYFDPSTLAKSWTSPHAPDRVVARGLGESTSGNPSASPRRNGK